MKKNVSVEAAREYVSGLVGRDVDVKVNRGRNKVKRYKGVISEAHENVFVVKLKNDLFDRISCSYTDMVCGEISVVNAQI